MRSPFVVPDPRLMVFDATPLVSDWLWPSLTVYSAVPVVKVVLSVIERFESTARISKVPGDVLISWHSVPLAAHVDDNSGIAIEDIVVEPKAGSRVIAKL